MRPATRVQASYDVQQASDEAKQDNNPDELPVVRTEFAADCDINRILQRGGVPVFTRQPTYGEIDFTEDLADALHKVRLADTLFMELPPQLREEYRNRNILVQALTNGQITARMKEWLAENPQAHTDTNAELLKWLQKNHTAPASSQSAQPTPAADTSQPKPQSAPAAG